MNQTSEDAIKALTLANNIYRAALKADSNDATMHRTYLEGRGFIAESLSFFGVGYCSGRDAISRLVEFNLMEQAIEVGLACQFDDKAPYERFWKRITFPLRRVQDGKIIAIGGRSLNPEKSKYVNSPESELFKKRNNLYGLWQARKHIIENGYAVLCEGYLDVIGLWQIGVRNAVAPMGTALAQEQINLLRNYTNSVLICMDGDNAGKESMLKSHGLLAKNNFKTKARILPGGKDPGELALSSPNDMLALASWSSGR